MGNADILAADRDLNYVSSRAYPAQRSLIKVIVDEPTQPYRYTNGGKPAWN